MKTAVASPDEGPDKKKYGIPPKDKKGLPKKNEYEYKSDRYKKAPSPNKYREGDPQKKYNNAGESGKPSHLPKNPRNEDTKRRQMQEEKKRTIKMPKDYQPKPKPESPRDKYALDELKKRSEMRNQKMEANLKVKKDYKVVENKIKKPEDKKKENKITKKASRSKTPIRMKNKKAK
jgi:hypothetical protein